MPLTQRKDAAGPCWYIDRPGNVIHRSDCTHREDATRWAEADGLAAGAVLYRSRGMCPAPCMRGLRCADYGFGPTVGQLDLFEEAP